VEQVFNKGYNPFAGYNPASSFGGISSLFTSPIGTQTGLQLGQYEMFGGPGSGGDQATRKAIGEQIAQTSRDAAVPPGTFIDAGVDSGIKVADYTGELISNTGGEVVKQATRGYMDITKDLFSGDFTTMGNAAKELGGKALKDIYTTPITNQAGKIVDYKLDKMAVIATLSTIPTYLDAKKAADDAGIEGFDEATYNAERDKYMERYKTNLPASSFGIQAAANGGRIGFNNGSEDYGKLIDAYERGIDVVPGESLTDYINRIRESERKNSAMGGRIGYREGTPREGIVSLTDEDSGVIYRDPKTGEPLTTTEFLRRAQEDEDKELDDDAPSITLPKKKTFRERTMEIAVPKQINRELEDKFENYLKKLVTGKKDGGRMGFMMGTEVPMRQNQGGITELDYRKTGGFVPVGVKERADDVPAMLSKNEFVFTADAVRGAGKGDINKGAKMMYAKMKALEGKVKKLKKTKKKKVKV
jgi:hypothetical protein